jgi:dipeptidyl aminopeptidase/acylaminoacyl peptidase
MVAMDRVSDPRVSPDGKWVAFVVRVTDLEANKGRMDLWLAPVDGTSVRRLTTHEANDVNPRWSRDGKVLYFLSSRSGSSQVWSLPMAGGEPTQVTTFPVDVENMDVFPDGTRLLLTMEVYPELPAATALEETAKRDAEKEKTKVRARVYESLLFRHWDTWEDGKRSHAFTWPLAGGPAVDLTRSLEADVPTKPWGGMEELSISPDGKEVAFAAKVVAKDSAWSTDVNIYLVASDGSGVPRCVTCDNKAFDNQPTYSPDGKTLAYLAMKRPGYEADRTRITLLDRATGKARVLTEAWDRLPTEIAWSKDGKSILAVADHLGNTSLFSVDVGSGKVTVIGEKGSHRSPVSLGARVLFGRDDLSSPVELYTALAKDGSDVKPVTRMNAEKLKLAQVGAFEQFSFPGAKEEKVYGWVVKPVGFKEGQKYPVAFLIHGGPQGSFGNHFHYRWNPQAYAGAGYAAVFIDFHGSTGYGQAFTDAIRGDWGGAPYEDLMKGLDFAVGKYGFLDGDKVCALGASYGGYMVNWIAGQPGASKFKCLVTHDGNLDERMAYFDTEELWFPEWEHGGTPWDNPAGFAKHNPIDHVKNWKTPTLVVHGALDFRVVDTQGMSTFTALQRRGIPSKFLHFPDENHWVQKPQNSILWHNTVLGWLDQWLK